MKMLLFLDFHLPKDGFYWSREISELGKNPIASLTREHVVNCHWMLRKTWKNFSKFIWKLQKDSWITLINPKGKWWSMSRCSSQLVLLSSPSRCSGSKITMLPRRDRCLRRCGKASRALICLGKCSTVFHGQTIVNHKQCELTPWK